MRHGFDLGYKTWVYHGEPALSPSLPVIDNTRRPQMSDMTALLNDLSYIPPNNEHNDNTGSNWTRSQATYEAQGGSEYCGLLRGNYARAMGCLLYNRELGEMDLVDIVASLRAVTVHHYSLHDRINSPECVAFSIESEESCQQDVEDPSTVTRQDKDPRDNAKPHWKVVEHVNHKKFSDGGVIVVEDDPDIIHFDNSSDLPLSTSLNDLDNATLHIDGQSTEVDAPLDIIDVVDEDDDIIDDEDALPHDLADSDDEDLINIDDDGVGKISVDVARSHGDDGGGEDRPPPYHVATGCGGCFANRGKGKRKPNLGGRAAGMLHTRDKTRNLSLKEITDKKGLVPILLRSEGAKGDAHNRY
ncbi:hypothetical protein Tco_0866765 [Tanacetum coccineum]